MSFTVSNLKYIEPRDLRSWMKAMKSPTGEGHFAVVDVRDSDYIGGHIMGSWHYPSNRLETELPKLYEQVEKAHINDVVFHCMLSQQRGPSAAMRFMRSLEERGYDPANFRVWILRGGFSSWAQHYGDDMAITEDYVKDLWDF